MEDVFHILRINNFADNARQSWFVNVGSVRAKLTQACLVSSLYQVNIIQWKFEQFSSMFLDHHIDTVNMCQYHKPRYC